MCFALFILKFSWKKRGTAFANHRIYLKEAAFINLELWEPFCNLLELGWHCCFCSVCKHSELYWNTEGSCAPYSLSDFSKVLHAVFVFVMCPSYTESQECAWWRKVFSSLTLRITCFIALLYKTSLKKRPLVSGNCMAYSSSCLLFLCVRSCDMDYKKHTKSQFLLERVWNRTVCVEGAITTSMWALPKFSKTLWISNYFHQR